MNLRNTITLSFLFIAVVVIAGVGLVSFLQFKETLTENKLRELDTLASIQEERVLEVIERGSSVAAKEIIAIVSGFTGNTQTGEMLIAIRNDDGNAVFLHERRFEAEALQGHNSIPKTATDRPIIQALSHNETIFAEAIDYRGHHVFAATRYIADGDYGLVVKIDREEALSSVYTMGYFFVVVGLLAFIVIVVVAFVIARRITRPLDELTRVAQHIQDGNVSLRVTTTGKGEVALLAHAFNNMLTRLQDLYHGLEENVRQRTVQLEESTSKNEAILASIGDGLVFVDTQKRVVFINTVAEELIGWDGTQIQGKHWLSLVDVRDGKGEKVPTEKLPIEVALASLGTMSTTSMDSYFYTRQDGSRFPVAITASSVSVRDEVIGGIIVFRDITQEKAVDTAKSEFVSLASHQLRTPLSAVRWYTEMLLAGDAGKITKKQTRYLTEVYRGIERMVELVGALLNVSRLDLGTFIVEPEETNIIELIRSVIDEQASAIDEKKLSVALDADEAIPLISIDRRLMRMVLENLISNAVKYTPDKGSVSCVVSQRRENHELLIEVTDTGMGIPQEQYPDIFSKLFRADNVKQTDTEGTGLGLYIVKSIIEHAGGTIWFESELGTGTSFYMSLPMSGMKKQTGSTSII